MIQKLSVAFDQAEKSVGTKRLHESLHRAELERVGKRFGRRATAIMLNQFGAFDVRKRRHADRKGAMQRRIPPGRGAFPGNRSGKRRHCEQ